MTNLQTGVSGKTVLLDFVEEVQVKSSGYNAEFGGATGGVVNVLTKSGSNAFRGQAGVYYQTDDMYGKIRPQARFNPIDSNLAETGMITPNNGWTYYSPVADLGGPLLRDRLWFYGGAAYTKNENSNDVIFRTDVSKTKRHFESWDDAKYDNYNVTSQLSNNLRVKFAGSNQRNVSRGTLPALQPDNAVNLATNSVYPNGVPSAGMSLSTFDANPDGSLNQTAFNNRWLNQGDNRENDTYSGNVDWVVGPSFFVNVTGGVYRTNRTTPAEFRGDAIRHFLHGCQYRFGHDDCRLPDGADAVPAAERLQRQHLVERHGARPLQSPLHQRQRDDVRQFRRASRHQDRHPLRAVLERRAQRPRPARGRPALRPEVHRFERPDLCRHLRLLHRQPAWARSGRCTRTTTGCGSRTPGTSVRA